MKSNQESVQDLINQLEASLNDAQAGIENTYMQLGRSRLRSESYEGIANFFRAYSEAWQMFFYQLDELGRPPDSLLSRRDERIDNFGRLARVYILKSNQQLYGNISLLSKCAFELGRASARGSVDDIRMASLHVQKAREEIRARWQEIIDQSRPYLMELDIPVK